MKKFLPLALALLILCGCGTETPASTEPATPDTTPATEEIVIRYDTLELLEFEYEDIYAAAPMGDDLLLFSGDTETTLIKLSGRNHKEITAISTNEYLSPGDPAVRISENGVCYAAEEEYIFLDENLAEIERISLPDAWGTGVVTADQQTIYYSTGSALRIYSRETGLDRLLRETTHSTLALESLELDDSILVCQLFDDSTVPPTLFYSTATGELLETYENSITLTSAGDLWLAEVSDGRRNQLLFGTGSAEPRVLTAAESGDAVTLVSGGVLIRTQAEETVTIRFLNLADSTAATITLDGNSLVTNAWREDDILWFSLDDGRLCRCNLEDTEMQASVSCIGPYFTRENPDTEGLAALESVIADLENTHGVVIHIYEDAAAVRPEGTTLVSEYQVDTLRAGLEELDLALSKFTPEFLKNVGRASDDGKVHISLVRSVESNGCIQFWDDDGIARIILAVDGETQPNFFHGLGHIIDARVMSECSAFDNWKRLNPKGFSYSYDYSAERDPDEFPGAFADSLGMTSPVEDRASVFAHAMLADMDSIFDSDTVQEKLSTLCAGIRKAFGLINSGETLPWEQYLAE